MSALQGHCQSRGPSLSVCSILLWVIIYFQVIYSRMREGASMLSHGIGLTALNACSIVPGTLPASWGTLNVNTVQLWGNRLQGMHSQVLCNQTWV